jgi:putative flippase GtrA
MIIKELARFLVSGVFNTIFSYLVYLALNTFLSYVVAYTLAFIISAFTSYFLHSMFVFDEKLTIMKSAQYQVMAVAMYFVGTATLFVLVDKFGVSESLGPVLVLPVVVPLSYLIGRFIIKKPASSKVTDEAPD